MMNLSADQIQIIWNQYKDEQEWQRHNETQRATLSQILLSISAALVALFPKSPQVGDWLIPAFLIGIGLFGILVVLKYSERFLSHVAVAGEYRKVLDAFFKPENGDQNLQKYLFTETLEAAIAHHNEKTFFALRTVYFRQHWLWVGLFASITILGLTLLWRVPA